MVVLPVRSFSIHGMDDFAFTFLCMKINSSNCAHRATVFVLSLISTLLNCKQYLTLYLSYTCSLVIVCIAPLHNRHWLLCLMCYQWYHVGWCLRRKQKKDRSQGKCLLYSTFRIKHTISPCLYIIYNYIYNTKTSIYCLALINRHLTTST